jgi:leukocyte elastase inhibitor
MVISPFSLVALFTMLYRGSKGGTEDELRELIGYTEKSNTALNMCKLIKSLNNTRSIVTGLAIFFPKSFPLNRAFIDHVKDIGFIDNMNNQLSGKETLRINSIIQKMTRNTIKDAVQPQYIENNSSMFLLATIFFYSRWRIPFDATQTKNRLFYGQPHRNIPMMTKPHESCEYYEDNVNQILELQFGDDEFSMGFILPKNSGDLSINHEQIEFYIKKMRTTNMGMIQIPKFKQQSRFKVDNLFRRLGFKDLFTNADLGEITPSNNILYISDIIHQSYIVVNEAGMKIDKHRLTTINNTKPSHHAKNFIANHPFIYYIRHIPSSMILMIGHFC